MIKEDGVKKKTEVKAKAEAPKKKMFDMTGHKKRFAELKPRMLRRPRPEEHDGHGNIRFKMD